MIGFHSLYKSQKWTDVTLTVRPSAGAPGSGSGSVSASASEASASASAGGKVRSWRAHRIVLAAGSAHFAALLFGPHTESSQSVVDLSGTPAAADVRLFDVLLQFMYCGALRVDTSAASPPLTDPLRLKALMSLLSMADYFAVTGLTAALSQFLAQRLKFTPETAVHWINAAAHVSDTTLHDSALRYAYRHFAAVSQTAGFLQWTDSQLSAAVQSDALCCAEVDIFKAVQRWATHRAATGATVTTAPAMVARGRHRSVGCQFVGPPNAAVAQRCAGWRWRWGRPFRCQCSGCQSRSDCRSGAHDGRGRSQTGRSACTEAVAQTARHQQRRGGRSGWSAGNDARVEHFQTDRSRGRCGSGCGCGCRWRCGGRRRRERSRWSVDGPVVE
jgi:hypothetical protein